MNIVKRLGVLGLLCLLASTGRAEEPAASSDSYRLQAGDVLTVSVWKETDLTAEIFVRPDGFISFPLSGDVQAANHTVSELRDALEERVRKLVPEAAVSVLLKLPQGNRIYVLGKVQKPGDFMMVRPTDVMQAVALAGGTTPFADLNDIRILRRENGRQISLPFRYGDVERGRRLDQNILLRGGDTVVVP